MLGSKSIFIISADIVGDAGASSPVLYLLPGAVNRAHDGLCSLADGLERSRLRLGSIVDELPAHKLPRIPELRVPVPA